MDHSWSGSLPSIGESDARSWKQANDSQLPKDLRSDIKCLQALLVSDVRGLK